MARRSAGEGSVCQRTDGKWCAALQLGGKRLYVYGKTRTEAAEKLRSLSGQATANGRLPDAGKLTLSEYAKDWLEQATLRPGTLADYESLARCHVLPHLGDVKVSKLQPLHLARLYATLRKAGVGARRVQMAHRLLHKLLNDARRYGLIPNNPASMVDTPRCTLAEPTLWTSEQARTFLHAIQQGEGGEYRNLLGLLLASGCRRGEALGLKWTDVDFNNSTIRVERQTTHVNNRPIEQTPKSKAGLRTIMLPSWAVQLLHHQRAQVAAWKLRSTAAFPSDRVFPTRVGTVPSPTNLRRAFHSLCTTLHLPLIRIHDLRHLHLSLLAMNGVPLKVAQQRAGHSSAQLTMQVYTHVLGESANIAAEAMERIGG